MNKQVVVHTMQTLFRNKNEWTADTCYNTENTLCPGHNVVSEQIQFHL